LVQTAIPAPRAAGNIHLRKAPTFITVYSIAFP
jgi:hypothetical protein